MDKHKHDHCHKEEFFHSHSHNHAHHHHATENILFAFILNLFFAIVELIGGVITGSVAILSDALHDFGDCISLGVAWQLQKISNAGSDAKFSYGYKRFSLLGALFISLILLSGSIIVIYSAIQKIITPGNPDAKGMIILAVFGLIVNGWAALRLSKGHTINERALMLHMMEDVLGWAAVLIVSIVMYFVNIPILDPLLSIAIAIWILYNVYFNLRDSLKILLQGVPSDINKDSLIKHILDINGVISIHDIHLWTLDGEEHIASIHVVIDREKINDTDCFCEMKQQIRKIASEHKIEHITIEFDIDGYQCSLSNCCN